MMLHMLICLCPRLLRLRVAAPCLCSRLRVNSVLLQENAQRFLVGVWATRPGQVEQIFHRLVYNHRNLTNEPIFLAILFPMSIYNTKGTVSWSRAFICFSLCHPSLHASSPPHTAVFSSSHHPVVNTSPQQMPFLVYLVPRLRKAMAIVTTSKRLSSLQRAAFP